MKYKRIRYGAICGVLALTVVFAVWRRVTPSPTVERMVSGSGRCSGLARSFLPELPAPGDEAGGVAREIPDSLSGFAIAHMGLIGELKRTGRLMAYYEALKEGYRRHPDDLDLLRMLVAVSSVPSLGLSDDYAAWLAELARYDAHEDVTFPYAEVLLERREPAAALEQIERTVREHPDQAVEVLCNALRIFSAAKAEPERREIVGQLKAIDGMDVFHASSCGDTLYRHEDFDAARIFYVRSSAAAGDSDFYRELADVKIHAIDARLGAATDRTVAELRRLVRESDIPAVQSEASRTLHELGLTLDEHPAPPSNDNP